MGSLPTAPPPLCGGCASMPAPILLIRSYRAHCPRTQTTLKRSVRHLLSHAGVDTVRWPAPLCATVGSSCTSFALLVCGRGYVVELLGERRGRRRPALQLAQRCDLVRLDRAGCPFTARCGPSVDMTFVHVLATGGHSCLHLGHWHRRGTATGIGAAQQVVWVVRQVV